MPLPDRWLTSLMMRYNGTSILVDCGEGTQIAMKEKGWSPNPVSVMLFTHYHADHISGLPGMLLSMGNSQRTEPVLMCGPRGLEKVVSALRVIAPELPFEIRYKEFSQPEETFSLPGNDDFLITAFKVNHRVTCYGYSFTLRRAGRFDADRARQFGIPVRCWNKLQKGEPVTEAEAAAAEKRAPDPARAGQIIYTPDMVLGEARKGLKVTYVTDTRPTAAIVTAAEGADLFICEGMYGDDDKEGKARDKKHMTMAEAARIGKSAQPARMWLTHYSPSEMYPENYIPSVRKIFDRVQAGTDGKTITLNFEDDTLTECRTVTDNEDE